MKRNILVLIVYFFVFPALVFADEYVLVMSKDDNVCQHMLDIYNNDLNKYGHINYDKHKEFNAIKWTEKRQNRMLISKFDINNDGREEIVIKDKALTIRGINGEGLYYFKETDSEYFKDDINLDIFTRSIGRLTTTVGDSYKLKELPQFLYIDAGDKKSKAYYSLGRYLYFNPFLFERAYYLEAKDEIPTNPSGTYSGKYLIILKYTKDNQPQDTCYFLKTNDCREKMKEVK